MIAHAKWFSRRKYGGWGVTPKTWQGWAYLAIVMVIPLIWVALSGNDTRMLGVFLSVWIFFLLIDLIPVMIGLKKDEREAHIEAIAERNTAWFMSIVLVLSLAHDISRTVIEKGASLPLGFNESLAVIMSHTNGFVLVALIGGVIVKSVSNYILDRE